MESGLVFDIGLCNGDDSRYYLDLGYSVVGVEANPFLAEECRHRFAKEIEKERMKVVNAGVLKESGSFTFYRNLVSDDLSSFVRLKGNPDDWEEMTIPCVTTKDLITGHGKPCFMKIDIEGADLQALAPLTPAECPSYVSLDLGNNGAEILDRLVELGYSAFKIVDGKTYWSSLPILDSELGWRMLRKAGRLSGFIGGRISKLPLRFRNKTEWDVTEKYNPDSYEFGRWCSGPFGESASGPWRTSASARRFLDKVARNFRIRGCGDFIWWDVHARHSSIGK